MSDLSSQKDNANSNALEIIEFYIDETLPDGSAYRSYYGMNVAKVLEIIRIPAITGMPGKHHAAALGTFNLRGRVLPLVDLGVWLNKNAVETDSQKVIVSEFSGIVTAFIVSGVTRIHRITWAQVEPPGKYLQAFSHDCVTGVMRMEDRILFLLDMEYVIGTMDPSIKLDQHLGKEGSMHGFGQGLHVLVVDDSTSVRNSIATTLEKEKFTVTKAASGTEAWNILTEWERQAGANQGQVSDFVDLIITDIEMPEMDGLTLTRKIKDAPAFKALPVILFSSIITQVVRDRGLKAGADDQISKPDLPQLTTRAKALINAFAANKQA